MAEGGAAGGPDGIVETYTYSAGSYDRLKSNEGSLAMHAGGVWGCMGN